MSVSKLLIASLALLGTTTAAMAAPAAAPAPACTVLNVNTATLSQLDDLPQVGVTRAKQIADARPYGSVADVAKVVPQAYPSIKDCLKVEKVNINTATAAELADKLPGVAGKTADKIVAARPYRKEADLARAMTPAQIAADKPLLNY